jgi:hypothetical protein
MLPPPKCALSCPRSLPECSYHHKTHLFVLSAFWHYVPSSYCRPNMQSLCRLPPASHHAPATQMRPPLASSEHYTMHTLLAPNLLLASHSLDQFVRNPYQRPTFSFLRHHWKAYSGVSWRYAAVLFPPSAIPQMRILSDGSTRPMIGNIASPSTTTPAQQSSPPCTTSSTNGVNGNHTDALAPSDRFSSASHLIGHRFTDTKGDVLAWWHEHRAMYPCLSRMALNYLTIRRCLYSNPCCLPSLGVTAFA